MGTGASAIKAITVRHPKALKKRPRGKAHSPQIVQAVKPSTPSQASLVTLHLDDYNSSPTLSNKNLTIIHFNDVYNIEGREKEPVGGAARFKTLVDDLSDKNPLVLFSGDALAPSKMSIVTMGKQMVPILNSFGVEAAVFGNHDFDFGVDHLIDIAHSSKFPWLMTNVACKYTSTQLGEGLDYLITEWNDIKIGLLGLVEEEWLATLATLSIEDVVYTDYVESARHYIPLLKDEGCELIIALTHMRLPNDQRLAREVPNIHIILGGHDHNYWESKVNRTHIVKSGSDFQCFSELTVTISSNNSVEVNVKKHTVTKNVVENTEVKQIVEEYMKLVQEGLDKDIGSIHCTLDGRFTSVRTSETNLGNMVTDIMSAATRSDCSLINSGTFRSDDTHHPGPFKMKDLVTILPMVDPLVVLEITGEQLIYALENGVSQYPKLEGRFPQVSGIRFCFDSSRPAGQRVLTKSILIKGQNIVLSKKYKLCTKSYLAAGKDGYNIFKSLPTLINEEEGPILCTVVRNYFIAQTSISRGFINSATSIQSAIAAMAAKSAGEINPQTEGRIKII